MTEVTCLAASQATPARLRALAAGGSLTLWYVADAYAPLAAIRAAGIEGLDVAPLNAAVNRFAAEHRQALIDLSDLIWPDRPAPEPAWSASNMADRGPYLSSLQRDVVRAMAIAEGTAKGGRHVVVGDDMDAARALADRRPGAGFKLRQLIRGLRARISGVAGLRRQKQALAKLRRDVRPPADTEIMLAAWVDEGTFAGETPRTVFGPLPAILAGTGSKVAFLANPLTWLADPVKIIEAAGRGRHAVRFPLEFTAWRDVAAELSGSLALALRLPPAIRLAGVDIAAVVECAAWRDAAAWGPVLARLYARVVPKLAVQARALRSFVFTYENQPWEKCLMIGAPGSVRMIGVQVSPFAQDYLAFFPERGTVASGEVPDLLCVPGAGYVDWYCQAGFPAERLRVGGALRFAGLHDVPWREPAPDEAPAFTVVCALSIEINESLELAHKVWNGLREIKGVRMIVNFHPSMPTEWRDRVCDLLTGPGPELVISNESIGELRNEADLVAYNASGAAFEALAAGVPVLFVGRHATIDHDKVPEKLRWRAVEPEEIRERVLALMVGSVERPSLAAIRDELNVFLAPIDASGLLAAIAPEAQNVSG